MTPEGRVKAAVKAYLKTLANCWWFLPVSNGMGSMGIPDFIICYRGVFIGLETKAPGKENNVTPLQARNIAHINGAGGYAFAASTLDQLKAVIQRIDAALDQRLSHDVAMRFTRADLKVAG